MNATPAPATPAPAVRRNSNAGRGRRWLPWLGAVLLGLLVLAAVWPRPIPVELATVQRGRLRATVNEEGRTRIRNRFVVSAPVGGQLRRLGLKAGAEVQGGTTVVAVIDPIDPPLLDERTRGLAEARRATAASQQQKAAAAEAYAASELRRVQKLHDEKTATAQELEAAQWRATSAARDRAAAESALREAEAQLAEFGLRGNPAGPAAHGMIEVKAPATGRVLRVFEESARVVGAGAPLLEVGDPGDLEAVVEVLSRDGAAIAPGTRVELHQWGGAEPLEARVRLVEPAGFTKLSALGVEEQRVRVIVDLATPVERRPGLGDNFRVDARIVVWEADGVLVVPAGALFRRGQDWAASVVSEGRAQLRRVKVGRSNSTEFQVLEGLREGEQLVLYPGDRVRDGQRVRPIAI
jgi:HlyD family secretion protein